MKTIGDYYDDTGCGFAALLMVLFALLFSGCNGGDVLDAVTLQGDTASDAIADGFDGVNQNLSVLNERARLIQGEINQEGADRAADDAANTDRIVNAIGQGADPADEVPRIPDENENGGVVDRSQIYGDLNQSGFLWKPISEGDGNLVVLTRPPSSGDPVRAMSVIYSSGSEVGEYQGLTNGGRPTFRFDMPGCGYGDNVVLAPGDTLSGQFQTIPFGCNRYDGGDADLP